MSGLKTNLFIQNINKGDRIQIDIMQKDFESIKNIPPWGKSISTYGVRDSQIEYLNVSAYNRELKRDRNSISIYIMIGISIFIFVNGLKFWLKDLSSQSRV